MNLLLFPLIPVIIVLLLFIPFKRFSSASKAHKNHPPSPRKLPIIGNLHQLGSNPHRSLQALTQEHGPLVLIQLGSVPVLVASSAEAAREILKTHDVIFASRPKLKIPATLTYGSKDIAFSPYGEYWRQVRSIAVLGLLSSRRVQSFKRVREEETHLMIDKIGESCGSLVDLSELLTSLTNNIVCRVALGRTYDHVTKFNDLLERFTYLLGAFSVGSYIPWLSWVDRVSGLEARTRKVAKEFDEVLEVALEEHINKKRVEGDVDGENDGQDLVDILLDAQKENNTTFIVERDIIKAAIMDLFAAGTDTTSTAIVWAISELIRHPRVMKRLQEEVREIAQEKSMISEEDLEKMHYLQAVLKETLRLYTPLPLLIYRESTQYVKVMGYDIPEGTQLIVNAWAIGRDPETWKEPEEFMPERFLNSSVDYNGLHFQFLPFGSGRRRCPGIRFAIIINELALANLVYKYDFSLPDDVRGDELDMSEITGLTLHRKSSLVVVAASRF